jgi:hypothetical protein
MTRERLTLIAISLLAAMAVATAQTPAPAGAQPGVGASTTSPDQIGKDASAILPSAGSAGASAAPTMIRDCKERPQECTTSPGPGDRGTAAGVQQPIRQ